MSEFDRLIGLHAERLQRVYDERTAGEFTFTSILAEFMVAYESAKLVETIERIKATEKEHPIKHTGVNFIVQMQNTDTAALDARAKTLTDLGIEAHQ
jgi:hypothetical protein